MGSGPPSRQDPYRVSARPPRSSTCSLFDPDQPAQHRTETTVFVPCCRKLRRFCVALRHKTAAHRARVPSFWGCVDASRTAYLDFDWFVLGL